MLSIGIRFGLGFDFLSSLKIMQNAPEEYTYDLAVLGSDPGGLALAREASAAGKKVVIIKWKDYSPAELEGRDEDMEEMAYALNIHPEKTPSVLQNQALEKSSDPELAQLATQAKKENEEKTKRQVSRMIQSSRSRTFTKRAKRGRKVRSSRLDLYNELFKRGQEGRRIMLNAVLHQSKVDDARNAGWRVPQIHTPMTFNWTKMSENLMDHIMKENWKLLTKLNAEKIDIFEGRPVFVNRNVIKVLDTGEDDPHISAEVFCVAPQSENKFPERIKGAFEFGITPDDFIRMDTSPLKTLVVGCTPEGLECAGIIVCSGQPVTVISQNRLLEGYDSEMSKMVIDDLKSRGVTFLERMTMLKVEMSREEDDERLVVRYGSNESALKIYQVQDEIAYGEPRRRRRAKEEYFDTVIFATGRKVEKDFMDLETAGIGLDSRGDIHTNEFDCSTVPHIYALGRIASIKPKGEEISEVAGEMLGKRLFHGKSDLMDYSLYPIVMYTPVEYAFVGISEDAATYRLGANCVEVFTKFFTPLDNIIPKKPGKCFLKLISLKPSGSVIGIHIAGPDAGEIIQGFLLALKKGITVQELYHSVGVPASKAKEVLRMKNLKKLEKNLLSMH